MMSLITFKGISLHLALSFKSPRDTELKTTSLKHHTSRLVLPLAGGWGGGGLTTGSSSLGRNEESLLSLDLQSSHCEHRAKTMVPPPVAKLESQMRTQPRSRSQ